MFTTNSTFKSDIEFLLNKLKNRENFSFSNNADRDWETSI